VTQQGATVLSDKPLTKNSEGLKYATVFRPVEFPYDTSTTRPSRITD